MRRTLRWGILAFFLIGILLIYLGDRFDSEGLTIAGFLCIPAVVLMGFTLFFMGGVASTRTRAVLTDRQKRLLDD